MSNECSIFILTEGVKWDTIKKKDEGGAEEMEKAVTCCFTGHRPAKLPWRDNEGDPRCAALKASMARELEKLYGRGFRHFISGMAQGSDLYFAEGVLALKEAHPEVTLECALPCRSQADRWPEGERRRYRALLERCDVETLVQENYDRWCMHRRDRYMVERSAAILAVYDGSPGGTRYTLDQAMRRGLRIFLLDLNHPGEVAAELSYASEK